MTDPSERAMVEADRKLTLLASECEKAADAGREDDAEIAALTADNAALREFIDNVLTVGRLSPEWADRARTLLDGATLALARGEVGYDASAPCRSCSLPVVSASLGGADLCSWCHMGVCRFDRAHRVDGCYDPQAGRIVARRHYEQFHAQELNRRDGA